MRLAEPHYCSLTRFVLQQCSAAQSCRNHVWTRLPLFQLAQAACIRLRAIPCALGSDAHPER